MFYPDILKDFAALTGDDLFILPSSIHEVLLSPVNKSLTVEETNQMICEINRLEVSAEEQLSDHVYYYQASCDRISLLNILVREYRCSGGTDTANPAAGNR